jgi:hypothetical protein
MKSVAVYIFSDEVVPYGINGKPMTENAFSLTTSKRLCPSVNLLKISKYDGMGSILFVINSNLDEMIKMQSILRMSIKLPQFAKIKI